MTEKLGSRVCASWTSTGTASLSVSPFCFDKQNGASVEELACGEHSSDGELEFAMWFHWMVEKDAMGQVDA